MSDESQVATTSRINQIVGTRCFSLSLDSVQSFRIVVIDIGIFQSFGESSKNLDWLGLAELKRKLRFDRRVPFPVDTALKRDSCVRDELNTAVCEGERRPLERPLERH